MIKEFLQKLQLNETRTSSIKAFAEKDRLRPYLKIIEENPNIINDLKKVYPSRIKDNWDCVVELYRYNIKLSKAIYPYLAILENVIKIELSNYLKQKYEEDFWFNHKLFYQVLEFNDFDISIIDKYFNHKFNKIVRDEIMSAYIENNNTISKKAIRNKIEKIKKAISVLSDASEYRFKNTNPSFIGFVETKPTLNYWITLLEITSLYRISEENSDKLDLKPIFPNIDKEDVRTLKTIAQKLDDIRLLRNAISHYNRIIYTNISQDLDLWDIYTNIIELFRLLGKDDVNYIIGDIACCTNGNFETLYKKFDFLHSAYKNKKVS